MPWPKGKKMTAEHRAKLGRKRYGAENANWKGGKSLSDEGYVLIRMPDHPNAMPNGYVKEHRIVMAEHLGRDLLPDEIVHHINGIKTDNRIENLELMSQPDHISGHNGAHSEETKARISAANKRFYNTPEGRDMQRRRATK